MMKTSSIAVPVYQDLYQKYNDFKWENPSDFKNAPILDNTRKFHDIFCCLIFLVSCVVILGFYYEHISYFLYVYDKN